MKKYLGWITCGFLSVAQSLFASDLLPVWTVDEGIFTTQGGGYNAFGKAPSDAFLQTSKKVFRGEGGRSIKISYRKAEEGYCGIWFHLFDENAKPEQRTFVDAAAYPYVSFWVRGEKGGEDFEVQLADPEWLARDDSRSAGLASKFLKGSLTTNWQEVVVPFDEFFLADPKAAVLTLNFTQPGEGVVYVDDLHFKKDALAAVPSSPASASTPTAQRKELARALWVWETKELLAKAAQRDAFFEFCQKYGINELFLQLVYTFDNPRSQTPACTIVRPELLRDFIRRASALNMKVHALDGYPEFTLEAHHGKPLAISRAVIAYNEQAQPEERFYGLHFDNEPYQIMGFDGPQRASIFVQFLGLNKKIMALLKEKNSDMVYGIDIPMWFDEGAGQENIVTFDDKTQDAARHLIDIVDNVGIMDYRTTAGGLDGIINHARGEIDYADQAGKKVYIGVETFRYEPQPVSFIYGPPEAEWQALEAGSSPLLSVSNVRDFRARSITDGRRHYLGLAPPVPLKQGGLFTNAFTELYATYGATAQGRTADLSEVSMEAADMISRNPEYEGFEEFTVKDAKGNLVAAGFNTTEYMLDKITFAGTSKRRLNAVLEETADYYMTHPSFIGFAIHYYTTYKELPE